jgi:hypothetical protein
VFDRRRREGHGSGGAAPHPGRSYLVSTGVPTDSSDGLTPEEYERAGLLPSAQHLSNPPTHAPDRSHQVRQFLAARVARDRQMQRAAARETDRD